MPETRMAGEGTGTTKQDTVRKGTGIVHDLITLVNYQSVDAKILTCGIVIDEDNVDESGRGNERRR